MTVSIRAAKSAKGRPLERFILLMVAGLTLFCVAAAGVGVYSLERERETQAAETVVNDRNSDQILELAVLTKQIQIDIIQVQQFFQDVAATRGRDGLDDGWQLAADNAAAFKRDAARGRALAGALGSPELAGAFDKITVAFPAYYAAGLALAHAYVDGGPEAGNRRMTGFDSVADDLSGRMTAAQSAFDVLEKKEAARRAASEARGRADQLMAMILSGVMALGACVLGGAVIVLTRSRLLRPLSVIGDYMGRLQNGDYETATPYCDRQDELGGMARSIAVFRQTAIERNEARRQQEAARAEAEAERVRGEQGRAEADAERSLVVAALAEGLGRMSRGNLRDSISQPFPPAYEGLRRDFNGALDRLGQALSVISGAAQTLRLGSDEIAMASDDLSRRTEQQAASLEETAAALDQISATVKRSTHGARDAAVVVARAKADAERSGDVVRRAVDAMGEIESSSREIGQIIGVIDEIAFQTNLLALNAGVEAARAGDSGRGFAVVAQEVRALAQRSAEAAKQIKALIRASEAQVASGVELVGQTGETMVRIVEEVTHIDSLVKEIARSSEEQAVGLNEVKTAVNQMDQTTQQNAAAMEETTAATHSIRQEAANLAQQVGEFQLPESHVGRRAAA